MTKRILSVLAVSAALAALGCGGKGEDSQLASMKVHLVSPPSFDGSSLLICGHRSVPADPKYPCASEVPCTCFDFASDGSVDAEIAGLCPSKDLPKADWTFSYTLYSGPCQQGQPTGDAINPARGNPNNFACFDFADPGALRLPNRSVERLEPGCNENNIVCATENATKSFDFDVCVIVTPDCDQQPQGAPKAMCLPPPAPRALVLDCGCTLDAVDGCVCAEGVLGSESGGPPQIPAGCFFEVESDGGISIAGSRCLLVCGSTPGFGP